MVGLFPGDVLLAPPVLGCWGWSVVCHRTSLWHPVPFQAPWRCVEQSEGFVFGCYKFSSTGSRGFAALPQQWAMGLYFSCGACPAGRSGCRSGTGLSRLRAVVKQFLLLLIHLRFFHLFYNLKTGVSVV